MSVLTHMIHELQNAENLHHKAAEKGTRTVREWIGQIIMCELRLNCVS